MDLSEAFQHLKVGDIFHATYPGVGGGTGSAICLVTDADTKTITARTVTTHMRLVFDRVTLAAQWSGGDCEFTVSSTKKLPDGIYDIMLELDWKYDPSNPVDDPKLTRAQIDALLFVAKHYKA
jgi:hypothetical protein